MNNWKKILKEFFFSFVWLGVLILGLDILTKNLVVNYSHVDPRLTNGTLILIPNFLRINYLVNKNVAFGMGLGSDLANRIVFIIVALVISAALITYLIIKYKNINKFVRASLMLIIAGALGNCIDRIFFTPEYLGFPYNGVVDWIDFYGIWQFRFNIADSGVVVGAIMLIVYMIVEEINDARKKRAKEIKEEGNEKVLSKTEQEKLDRLNKKDK